MEQTLQPICKKIITRAAHIPHNPDYISAEESSFISIRKDAAQKYVPQKTKRLNYLKGSGSSSINKVMGFTEAPLGVLWDQSHAGVVGSFQAKELGQCLQ